jgi:hypothetical protein
MHYLDPIETTDAHLLAGTTLAEDPSPVWAAGTYAIGYLCHVVSTHRVYKRAVATASTVSPELDPAGWSNERPTNKWAPFDIYTSTSATATADITYVIACRFVNAVMLRGLVGKSVTISIKDAPGGAVILPAATYQLQHAATGYWDYAYGVRKPKPTLTLTGLPIRSNAEITITVTGASTNTRAIGMIVRGKLKTLQGSGFGGVQQGAQAIPKTYTYRKTNDDGSVTTVVRGSSKDLSLDAVMDISQADIAVQELELLLSRPVGVIATLVNGYAGLSAFGFITKSPVSYKSGHATTSIYVEGIV